MSDLEADRRARRRAQREFVRPLILEAGAGTGKTATLVSRVLSWCLGPGWRRASAAVEQHPLAASLSGRSEDERIAAGVLGGVVAITFTEAAAAEMAERVTSGLAQVHAGALPAGCDPPELPDGPRRQRAGRLLDAADQLQVRTIHSFCRKLLAEHPFEAGLHPGFTVDADGAVLREVVEEVVESALHAAYGEPGDPDFLTLAGLGKGPVEIAEAVFELAAQGLTAGDLAEDPLASAAQSELIERLWGPVQRLLTLLEVRRVAGSRARNAAAIRDGLRRLRRRLGRARETGTEVAALSRWVAESLPPALVDHLSSWARGRPANRSEARLLGDAIAKVAPAAGDLRRLCRHVGRLDPVLLAAGRRVVVPLLDLVREEMRVRGAVGFQDLLRCTAQLLDRRPAIAAHLRRRIDQLLVDEFQDTDGVQCDLIRRLALDGPEADRPGLFVVGDPKQSIYGWRSADLAAYESFVADAEVAGGERLPLVRNFRSRPAILDEVERVIAPVMRQESGLQPEFRPLVAPDPSPPMPLLGRGGVEHWISWQTDPGDPTRPIEGTARETAEIEASALAADLLELHRQGVPWNAVGLLLRSFTDLEVYLAALRQARIPFVVSRDRQYFRRREIIDAAALVRTVLAPGDHLALLTFLRSVAVGVPDAALIPLWTGRLPQLFSALGTGAEQLDELRALARRAAGQVPPDVPGIARVRGWEHNLTRAAETVSCLRREFESEPFDVFVERLRRLTLFEACEAARYLGAFRLANLERFFDELLRALAEEAGNRHRVLRRLRHAIARGEEAEEARPGEAGEDAVQVMTIHKAKGLEFGHVYLLQTHKEAGRRTDPAVEIVPAPRSASGGRLEYRLFGSPTLGFERCEHHRREVARAELTRTLYVAMTRARERLVLVGRRPLDDTPPALDEVSTHLDLLLHRREAPGSARLIESWTGGRSVVPDGEVLWRLPALESPAAEPAADAEPPSLRSVADVRRSVALLDRDRRAAARRMARKVRQVASKLGPQERDDDQRRIEDRQTAADPAGLLDDGDRARRAAMIAGSVIHRVLETLDLSTEPEEEIARQRRLLPRYLGQLCDPDEVASAGRARAERLFEKMAAGSLLRRLLALRDDVVARELPVLLPPADDGGIVGFVSGIVDLVYLDPATGELVVVDYKTDRLAAEDVPARAEHYAAQGAAYTRAVAEALGLDRPPRFELWFLEIDLCLPVISRRG